MGPRALLQLLAGVPQNIHHIHPVPCLHPFAETLPRCAHSWLRWTGGCRARWAARAPPCKQPASSCQRAAACCLPHGRQQGRAVLMPPPSLSARRRLCCLWAAGGGTWRRSCEAPQPRAFTHCCCTPPTHPWLDILACSRTCLACSRGMMPAWRRLLAVRCRPSSSCRGCWWRRACSQS